MPRQLTGKPSGAPPGKYRAVKPLTKTEPMARWVRDLDPATELFWDSMGRLYTDRECTRPTWPRLAIMDVSEVIAGDEDEAPESD